MRWTEKGLVTNGGKITNLSFADDVALLSSSLIKLENMIKEFAKKEMDSGLKMNAEKKILTKSTYYTNEVKVND